MHRPGRMMGRDIERLEVMKIVFDLGSFRYAETDLDEKSFDTLQGTGNGMQSTGLLAPSRQGYVDGFGA